MELLRQRLFEPYMPTCSNMGSQLFNEYIMHTFAWVELGIEI